MRKFFFKIPALQMSLLAFGVGVGGGIGAVFFHYFIELFQFMFYGLITHNTGNFLSDVTMLPWYIRIFIPATGGLIVGIILTHKKFADAEGEGVPEVLEAVRLERSKIQPIIGPIKALVSAITLGSGGAGGREGPIIQIGSALGSSMGQFFKLNQEQTRTLLAAGAAAAVAGTFNAPLAGMVFSYEVLLKKITAPIGTALLVAAATGTVVANVFLDPVGSFAFPNILPPTATETIFLALFGIIAAWIAIVFTYTLSRTEVAFRALKLPHYLKPALGGLLLGILALFIPHIQEPAAYEVLSQVFSESAFPLLVCGIFIIAKIIATSLTVGSGGSGGILAPSLFVGALSGTLYAKLLLHAKLIPVVSTTSFAMLGMGAVFAGISHAPLTAIVLIFELTDTFSIIPPLAVACYIAARLAHKYSERSVYAFHK